MKLTVKKQQLQQELALAQGVVESKATIPILSNLLLRADRDGLEVLATDLDIGIRSRCPADVTSGGLATVPARKLHDIVRALDCEVVSLETEENDWLRVEGGFFRGRVAGLPDADFPTQPEPQAGAASVRVPLAVFQQLLARVLFAVTTENTRFSINGALLAVKGDTISLVATDGHRLAHVVRPLSSGPTSELSVLVPRKALMELQRLRAADENDELEITTSGNHVFFRAGGRVLFSRVLEGSFPNYEKVIPKDNANVAHANRAALAAVISRVSILTSEASRQVSLSAGDGKVVVATSNPAMGEASEELAVTYEGEPVKIGLNSEYLAQFLQVLSAEKVEIRLKNGASQALFVPQGDGPWECQYVVMPMRLG